MAARFSPNRIVRRISVAVSSGSAPARALIAASRPSSSGERALASSSCGSMPIRRTSQFAEPLSAAINHLKSLEKVRSGAAVASATRIGRASAAFLGTSSPKSIDTRVATISASAWVMPRVASPAIGWTSGSNSLDRAGSAR